MVAVIGLSIETVALSRGSCAEYDRFGTLLRTAGARAGKILAQIVKKTDRLSVSIGNNVPLPILCCIIFETAEIINDSKTVKLESPPIASIIHWKYYWIHE
jgi:hypothetical protein